MDFSFDVLNDFQILCIPCSIEHPATNMIWQTPKAINNINQCHAVSNSCELCMFGKPFRKSTNFVSVHLGLAWMDNFRCNSAGGVCQRAGLAGKDPNNSKQLMTLSAQAYPRQLCSHIAKPSDHTTIVRKMENFQHLLTL